MNLSVDFQLRKRSFMAEVHPSPRPVAVYFLALTPLGKLLGTLSVCRAAKESIKRATERNLGDQKLITKAPFEKNLSSILHMHTRRVLAEPILRLGINFRSAHASVPTVFPETRRRLDRKSV